VDVCYCSSIRKVAAFVWGVHVNEGVGNTPVMTLYFKQRLISSLENGSLALLNTSVMHFFVLALKHSQNLAEGKKYQKECIMLLLWWH
jgi:hypothetical protein